MRSLFRKCVSCGRYTFSDTCPKCGSQAIVPVPVRFSPEDRYGEYRRTAIIQEYGENGKHRDL